MTSFVSSPGGFLLQDKNSATGNKAAKPARIQRKRTRGWRMPEGAIYVGRSTRWGNPFRLNTRSALARTPALDGSPWEYEGRISADGMEHNCQHADGHWTFHTIRYMTAAETVECYRALLLGGGWPLDFTHKGGYYPTAAEAREQLRGRALACWCPLDRPCHADVLLELANQEVSAPRSRSSSSVGESL